MKQLAILRHARPEPWNSELEDFSRPLSAEGIEHAAKIAHWADGAMEMPEDIICSPAQRTRETLAPLLCLRPELDRCTRFIPQIYGASKQTLLTLLDSAFCEADHVLIVGHNPGLEQLALEILAPMEAQQITHLQSGTLLVVGFKAGWPDEAGGGKLRYRIRGEEL